MSIPLMFEPALSRFKDNEYRFELFVNSDEGYTKPNGDFVQSLPAFLASVSANAIIAELLGIKTVYVAEVSNIKDDAVIAKDLAEAAQSEAESARDAALIQAGVYVTEVAGRAAVADGVAFKVQGSADVAAYEYRRVSSGVVSTLIATYPSSALVQSLKGAFDVIPPKNKFDPSLPLDGQVYSYTLGTYSAFATSIISGHHAVVEGNTYTVSQPSPEKGFLPNVFAWDISGNYLGMAATIGGSTVIAGMALSFTDAGGTGGYRKVTFTVPVGSGIAYVGFNMLFNYATHTTGDFNRIRNATQLEIGAVSTSFETYTTISIVEVKDDNIPSTIQRTESVLPLIDAFDVVEGRNLYNLANAADGHLTNYSDGTNLVYAPGMAFGKVPVVADTTYTASMTASLGFNSNHPLYCYDASGTYLGIDHTIGVTSGMANPPTGVVWTGDTKVTFTIPPGSLIAYVGFMANYSTHTTDEFNEVVATIQVEEGSTATSYQRYAPYGFIYPKDVQNSDTSTESVLPLKIAKSSNSVYLLGDFDSTRNIVQKITLQTGVAFTNDTINVDGAKTSTKDVEDVIAAWTGGTSLVVQGDDAAPLNYDGTYIGANHGALIVREVTQALHNKTVVDVGSEWTDGAAVKWYLMRIVDVNKLWFVSQNNASYPAWSFVTTITGSTLTHSSGATHTTAVSIDSSALTQLYPCLQGQTKTVLLDGITPVTASGEYRCRTLDVVNAYNVTNPAAVVTYVRSLVGGATQPSFIDSSIAADVRRTITYRYAENGSCEIIDGIRTFNSMNLGYFGATQALPLDHAGKQLWQYIPRTTPIVGTVKTWDFAAQEDISGTFEELHFGAANWTDANNLPDRMAQIVKTAGVAEYGFMVGYSPVRSVGVPALRKTLVTEACFVSALRKQYPKAVNGGTLAANSYYEIVAFRTFWSAVTNPDATAVAWYRDGKSVIVVADFHQNVTLSKIALPSQFVGMDISVVDKTASATVHGNNVVTPDGILISISGGYGYAVLKLS